MCQTTKDLFGNDVIATSKKAAKIVSTPTTEPPNTAPPSTRTIAVETLGITPNYISTYDTFFDGPNQNSVATAQFNFQDRHHDCKMSPSAIKTVKQCTQLICYLSRKEYFAKEVAAIRSGCTTKRRGEIEAEAVRNVKGYYDEDGNKIAGKHLCTFVTLTLPSDQRHTDRQICSQLLNPFMVWARKQKKVKYYMWKKELQSNGNLHIHIIWDRPMPWQDIRAEWNRLCNKGKVRGIKQPFDYVTRYHDKWTTIHKDGFNADYVREYVAQLPSTEELIKERFDAWESETGKTFSSDEYNQLRHDVIEGIVAKYYKSYKAEIYRELHGDKDGNKIKPYTRYTDPNSTDIKAVNSPQQVASYLSKYIAKDLDNNPALTNYQDQVKHLKDDLYEWQKTINSIEKEGKDANDAHEAWRHAKSDLDKFRRQNCPIKGRMWFKSKSLTVFLKGIPKTDENGKTTYDNASRQYMDENYIAELIDLENYLHNEEKRINQDRAKKAERAELRGDNELAEKLKQPISLVLERYDTTLSNVNLAYLISKTIAGDDSARAEKISAALSPDPRSGKMGVLDQTGTKLNRLQLAELIAGTIAKVDKQVAKTLSEGDENSVNTLITSILQIIMSNSKCICKTMLITMFDLQHLKTPSGRTRFPYLSTAWNRFINAGLDYNAQNNLIEKESQNENK